MDIVTSIVIGVILKSPINIRHLQKSHRNIPNMYYCEFCLYLLQYYCHYDSHYGTATLLFTKSLYRYTIVCVFNMQFKICCQGGTWKVEYNNNLHCFKMCVIWSNHIHIHIHCEMKIELFEGEICDIAVSINTANQIK